jgi:hypothetical protein
VLDGPVYRRVAPARVVLAVGLIEGRAARIEVRFVLAAVVAMVLVHGRTFVASLSAAVGLPPPITETPPIARAIPPITNPM